MLRANWLQKILKLLIAAKYWLPAKQLGHKALANECWDLGRTNSSTSTRYEDNLGYIRIWETPSKRLVFCDGVQVFTIGIRAG